MVYDPGHHHHPGRSNSLTRLSRLTPPRGSIADGDWRASMARASLMTNSGDGMPPKLSTATMGVVHMLVGESRPKKLYKTSNIGSDWHPMRVAIALLQETGTYKGLMAFTIMFNLGLMVKETDVKSLTGSVPFELELVSTILSCVYVLDLAAKLFSYRFAFFNTGMNVLDFVVVVIDLIIYVLDTAVGEDLPSVSVLRICRILRVVKVLNGVLILRELYLMMQGLLSALRSIAFGTALIALCLTIWSILAVNFLHARVLELDDRGVFADCSRCPEAFETVTQSILTFTQTVIAGDSWGTLALPLMNAYPETALIIIPTFISVQLGLVNVIAAVIVDRQQQARVDDEGLTHAEHQEELHRSFTRLQTLFRGMDEDGGGSLQLEELLDAYDHREEFREMLELLDISRNDLPLVFSILDADQSGDVDYEEFVQKLHYIKHINGHTLLVFIKKHAEDLVNIQQEVLSQLRAQGAIRHAGSLKSKSSTECDEYKFSKQCSSSSRATEVPPPVKAETPAADLQRITPREEKLTTETKTLGDKEAALPSKADAVAEHARKLDETRLDPSELQRRISQEIVTDVTQALVQAVQVAIKDSSVARTETLECCGTNHRFSNFSKEKENLPLVAPEPVPMPPSTEADGLLWAVSPSPRESATSSVSTNAVPHLLPFQGVGPIAMASPRGCSPLVTPRSVKLPSPRTAGSELRSAANGNSVQEDHIGWPVKEKLTPHVTKVTWV